MVRGVQKTAVFAADPGEGAGPPGVASPLPRRAGARLYCRPKSWVQYGPPAATYPTPMSV
ncbi:hypothetical protein Misp03_42710 [Microbispora sp. NBRC 16548]|nr:hypothetical protein Misp03_42710 [Microbispora sp. NBRC 16548]